MIIVFFADRTAKFAKDFSLKTLVQLICLHVSNFKGQNVMLNSIQCPCVHAYSALVHTLVHVDGYL